MINLKILSFRNLLIKFFRWTGSNKNPLNNDGQGLPGTDRSNIVLLTNKVKMFFLRIFF